MSEILEYGCAIYFYIRIKTHNTMFTTNFQHLTPIITPITIADCTTQNLPKLTKTHPLFVRKKENTSDTITSNIQVYILCINVR